MHALTITEQTDVSDYLRVFVREGGEYTLLQQMQGLLCTRRALIIPLFAGACMHLTAASLGWYKPDL